MKHALYLSLQCLREEIVLNVAVFGSPPCLTLHLFFFFFFSNFPHCVWVSSPEMTWLVTWY